MKHFISTIFIFSFFISIAAQQRYQYVIVPNNFEGFKEKNPYSLSSNARYLLAKNKIKVYYKGEVSSNEDPCKGLTVNIRNTSSFFKNKLQLGLENCRGIEVFSKEGKSATKEFKKGYTEILMTILSNVKTLPYMDDDILSIKGNKPSQSTSSIVNASAVAVEKPMVQIVETTEEYDPKNLYFNTTYMIDVIEQGTQKQLKIINGKLLGYQNLENIATLSPSGIDSNTFLLKWKTANNQKINGIAKFDKNTLNISLSTSKGTQIIKLQKR